MGKCKLNKWNEICTSDLLELFKSSKSFDTYTKGDHDSYTALKLRHRSHNDIELITCLG